MRSDEIVVPGSIFHYATSLLAADVSYWPISMAYLCFYFLLCECLILGFAVGAFERIAAANRTRSVGTHLCMSGSSWMGVPRSVLLTTLASVICTGFYMLQDDAEMGLALYAGDQSTTAMSMLLYLLFVLKYGMLSVQVMLSAALMFVSSENVQDVVLNSMAMVFIVDLDDLLYQNMLSDIQREHHKQVLQIALEQGRLSRGRMFSQAAIGMHTITLCCLVLSKYLQVIVGNEMLRGFDFILLLVYREWTDSLQVNVYSLLTYIAFAFRIGIIDYWASQHVRFYTVWLRILVVTFLFGCSFSLIPWADSLFSTHLLSRERWDHCYGPLVQAANESSAAAS